MIKNILIFCILFLLTLHSYAESSHGIKVIEVSTQEDDRVYYMDATIDINLPEYVTKAFYNGIPLPLVIEVEVKEANKWWFDESLVTIEQRYLIHYYPLYDSVRTENVTDGSSSNQSTLKYALKKIGIIQHYPILDKEHFSEVENLTAQVRLKIDSSRLPKPLRTSSLLGGSWDITSAWKVWKLHQRLPK